MKQIAYSMIAMSMLLTQIRDGVAQTPADSIAIRAAAMDYVEGWYQASVERMQRSLHPDLAKRAVREHPRSRRPLLSHLSKNTMLEYTRAGGGSDTPADQLFYEISILDIFNNIATVKGVSAKFVDYLHLAKWQERWLIINILWDDRQKKSSS